MCVSPISAINLGANVSPTPPMESTVLYSGMVLANSLIWFKIVKRDRLIPFKTLTASCTSNLVDCAVEDNVEILVLART